MTAQEKLIETLRKEKNLDYLQNRSGQTISSVYYLRPKNAAIVSIPLYWKEVKKGLMPQQFTIFNAAEIICKRADIFKGIFSAATIIEKCLKILNN